MTIREIIAVAGEEPMFLAAVLTAYARFFIRANLLDANALVYFLPIVTMVATLMFMSRRVEFDAVPGFDRLPGA